MEPKVKYRKGLPTITSLYELTREFFGDSYPMPYVGHTPATMVFSGRHNINERIPAFVDFLNGRLGRAKAEIVNLAEPGINGRIRISPCLDKRLQPDDNGNG